MKKIVWFISLICALLLAPISNAVIENVEFANAELETRYKDLIAEFRCLVCQNQNLADSNAELAKDLRRKTAEMLTAGADDAEIRQYMRDRYGDFVSYRPPFDSRTGLLWLSPIILLFIVGAGVMIHIRRRQTVEAQKPPQSNNDPGLAEAKRLLSDEPKNN